MNKTPREILLNSHRAADPALERLCTGLLAEEKDKEPVSETEGYHRTVRGRTRRRVVGRLWYELFWCCRHVWGGLAAAWVLIIGLQMALIESSPSGKPGVASGASSVPGYFAAQKRLLLELGDATAPAPAPSRPVLVPQTRSEGFRPDRAGSGFDAISQGVALGWSVAAPLGLVLAVAESAPTDVGGYRPVLEARC